jgi:hypothetical protein
VKSSAIAKLLRQQTLLKVTPRFTAFLFFGDESYSMAEENRLIFYITEVKVKPNLEQATKAQRGSRGIALLFNLGARLGWAVSATPRPLYLRERSGAH